MEQSVLFEGTTLAKRYKVLSKLGKGAFGEVYEGVHLKTHKNVAIKRESLDAFPPQLRFEAKLYKLFQSGSGFPGLLWFGVVGNYSVLVMELLGPSLKSLFQKCGNHFSLKTVVMLADQMIQRIEYVHSRNFLHRDIKPDNFTVGYGLRSHIVYLIDFGLAKRFRETETGEIIPISKGRNMLSQVYSSANAHLGFPQGRKDDLESLGLSVIYWLKGSLPWSNVRAKSSELRSKKIKELKESTSIEDLCSECPSEVKEYFQYCRSLNNEDKPDYTYLRDLFKNILKRENQKYDYDYDWKALIEKEEMAELGQSGEKVALEDDQVVKDTIRTPLRRSKTEREVRKKRRALV